MKTRFGGMAALAVCGLMAAGWVAEARAQTASPEARPATERYTFTGVSNVKGWAENRAMAQARGALGHGFRVVESRFAQEHGQWICTLVVEKGSGATVVGRSRWKGRAHRRARQEARRVARTPRYTVRSVTYRNEGGFWVCEMVVDF